MCHSHGVFDRTENSAEEGFIEMIYLPLNDENRDTELSKSEKENEEKFQKEMIWLAKSKL